jgi:predicted 3-demethylubiquinone-9 3-methyltransferase (glyoxalase superfamily)
MQKIVTHLWFDSEAEEAANFYTSLFEDSKVVDVAKYPEGGEAVSGKPAGSVMTVAFQLNGQEFLALNGGPIFTFSEAVSLLVRCKDQAEIDRLWDAFTKDGGEESQCGWLKDKFGFSWQIVPEEMSEFTTLPDPEARKRVFEALMPMHKIDIATLKKAGGIK